MIGIISNELEGFCILERISKKYPNINIYLCKMNGKIEEKIKILKSKKCKIIILPKEEENIKEKNKEINFISIERKINKNCFHFEEDIICKEIEKGNIKKIEEIVKNANILKQEKILLENPKMLWIKDLIEKNYKNEIITISDLLLEEISKIIEEKKLNPKETGIRSILI